MAKKKRATKQERRETKLQARRRRKEEEQQRLLLIALGILGVLVIGLLVWGAVQQYVIAPRAPIAVVDGTPIPTDAFQRRLAYERLSLQNQLRQWQQFQLQIDPKGENAFLNQQINQLAAQVNDVEGLSLQVLDQMIDEVLIREEAAKRGITASPEEVQARIDTFFGFDREAAQATPEPSPTPEPITTTETITPTATPIPTPTPMSLEAFQKLYTDYLQQLQSQALGFSEEEFRALFEVQVLREKLQDVLCNDVPTTEEAVRARHILIAIKTPTPEPVGEGTPTPTPDPEAQKKAEEEALKLAQEIKARLDAGEDFAELAKEYSDDPGSRDQGGDLGWFGKGQMVEEFEKAAFSLEPGEISEPVRSPFGYHIIQVLEKDPNRPRDETAIAADKRQCFQDWLNQRRGEAQIERYWSVDKIPAALKQQQP